jgi:DNA-binding MarR family transcriptional regulator
MAKLAMQASDGEPEIVLKLLTAVEKDHLLTQRRIAGDLGIALGLANAYLKRCVKKGYVKVTQVPASRYAYFLTSQGFAEKSRLTAQYLTQGFHFFRIARQQFDALFEECGRDGHGRVVLHGLTDLAEIAVLSARNRPVRIVAVVDASTKRKGYDGIPIVAELPEPQEFDAVVITDIGDPQHSYDSLARILPRDRILSPPFLNISGSARPVAESE